ncbi:MAG: outer membrane protein assembly factor [Rhodanobacteraceae bacterium]|nr:outer membrane protein assembly factor [Rhodanobacteraceae bacterium]
MTLKHKPKKNRFRQLLLVGMALTLPACATLWGDQEKAPPVDSAGSAAPRDRSQQRVRIFITGVKGEMRQAVSGSLELKGLMSRSDASDALVRRVYGRAPAQMSKALQPFGYYHAEVKSTLDLDGSTWMARFAVDPGEPTKVSAVSLAVDGPGGEDKAVKQAVAEFAPAVDAQLDHRIYEASKARIEDALAERGYLDAEILRKRVAVRLADHSAQVELKFASGPRFAFGPTSYQGSQLPDEVLSGYLPYEQGKPYRLDKLIELQQRLLDSDYFSEVEVTADKPNAVGETVPIVVRVSPAKRSVYTGGVSFGTDSGVGLLGGMTRRWVNQSGHKFSSRAELSQRLNSVSGQYLIPLRAADRESIGINLGYRDEETDTSTQKVTTLQISKIRENDEGLFAYGLAAQLGDFVAGEIPGSSTLFYPEVRWTRRLADDFLSPRQGWSLSLEARGAPAGLGDAAFAQVRAEAKLLRPQGERNRWFARLALGALWTDDFEQMPPELRFYAGGDRSLRGFAYQTLGPPNALGNVGGGRYLAVGSFEYEKHLFGDFGLAGFVDAGNAFNAGDFELAAGVGVGLRWRSPVGLVRVDLAHPVAGDGSGIRLHLTIGPEL